MAAEDNKTNQLIFSKMTKDLPIDLTFAGNGLEAVELYPKLRPDMVFMDISMPGMDGKEATRRIRAMEEERNWPPVPIIALTAHALPEDQKEMFDAGATDYMTKPLKRQEVTSRVLAHPSLCTDQTAALTNTQRSPSLRSG
ncbi:MAG: response regulator [Pseudomonadota bacterium]|nr:response regulator [Pseudomonadota bacterium]